MKKLLLVFLAFAVIFAAHGDKSDITQYVEKTMRVYCNKQNAPSVGMISAQVWKYLSPKSVLEECLQVTTSTKKEYCGYKIVWANDRTAIAEVWVKAEVEDVAQKLMDDIYKLMTKTIGANNQDGSFRFEFIMQ